MPEKLQISLDSETVRFLKREALLEEISVSEWLRRLIDIYKEWKTNNGGDQESTPAKT